MGASPTATALSSLRDGAASRLHPDGLQSTGAGLDSLPQRHFGAIYADPPWSFITRAQARTTGKLKGGDRSPPYPTMTRAEIKALPVSDLAADDCVLFLWVCWPNLLETLEVIESWGFTYKTCAFAWVKAHAAQVEMFRDDADVQLGTGYWTRANSEVCLLATRGNPKRRDAGVRQAIIEPRRQHSRKPDCVPSRIERLVDGPYLELFARTEREGWTMWGNQVGKFAPAQVDTHPEGGDSLLAPFMGSAVGCKPMRPDTQPTPLTPEKG